MGKLLLLVALIGMGFLFLTSLTRKALSESEQTVAWIALTVAFFSVCSVWARC